MSYYTVLSATNTLLSQQHFAMRRCRRRFNGPHRYVLFDTEGHTVHFSEQTRVRRMGYTLLEILEWLIHSPNPEISRTARTLRNESEDWYQIKAAI